MRGNPEEEGIARRKRGDDLSCGMRDPLGRRWKMAQLQIDIPVTEVAKIIESMTREEVETLSLLLTEDGKELIRRKEDLDSKKVAFLNREEVQDV